MDASIIFLGRFFRRRLLATFRGFSTLTQAPGFLLLLALFLLRLMLVASLADALTFVLQFLVLGLDLFLSGRVVATSTGAVTFR